MHYVILFSFYPILRSVNYNTYYLNSFGIFYLNTLNKILTNTPHCPTAMHKVYNYINAYNYKLVKKIPNTR